LGHDAVDVRDIGMGSADDGEIAAYAAAGGLCVLSGDFGFADIRRYSPQQCHGIVVFELPRVSNRQMILDLIHDFIRQGHVIAQLPGRLAIVRQGRVRLRPA